ncbi:uncharacterized protein LOC130636283 [Hydractinia symbiolongicarpus]|uniref:uncharacterized protein LOC130636283 n=1 Tax=Hydractinia symbiolongicarpus TaxID=13093 RepID=UPI002550E5CC|nr:uncharacterized protein LOC130636283 [Hydractinia symbiolongicarpus]
MRQNYLEDVLEKYVVKEDVSRLVSLFQKEEKQVGLFVKYLLKSGNDFKETENNRLIAELLLHPAFFQDEVYNNILLYTAFYSPIDTIFYIFHGIRDLITEDYFNNDLKYSISAYGEDVLSILTNFRIPNDEVTPKEFRKLYKEFFYDKDVPPTNYTNKGSALYHLIQHKQLELALFVLQKTNINILSNGQRESLLSAIKKLSLNLKHISLASKDERLCWGKALSLPSVSHPSGREAKARAGCHILREKSAPPNSRAQILRQIATQLLNFRARWRRKFFKTVVFFFRNIF